jgi:hypothetical protein
LVAVLIQGVKLRSYEKETIPYCTIVSHEQHGSGWMQRRQLVHLHSSCLDQRCSDDASVHEQVRDTSKVTLGQVSKTQAGQAVFARPIF